MKKEASGKKSLLWLWIVLGVVIVAAAVAAVFLFVLPKDEPEQTQQEEEIVYSDFYINLDQEKMLDPESMLSLREPAEDGLYYIRFSVGGREETYPVADKLLVSRIDAMQLMCLSFDQDGVIVDAFAPTKQYTVIADGAFVQNIEGQEVLLNSAQTYNGLETPVTLGENVPVYNIIKARPEVPGRDFVMGSLDELEIMDRVTIYGTDENTPVAAFVDYRPYESEIYWRVERFYDATNKCTTRELAEDGYWYIDFLVNGEIVTKRTNQQLIADTIDAYGLIGACCSLVFNQEGDIIDCFSAAYAIRGKVAANNYNVMSVDSSVVSTERLIAGTEVGRTYTCVLGEDTKIYNVNSTAETFGEETELQEGDLIYVISDSMGNPKVIFVTNRYVDSPMYFNINQKYDSKTKTTSRVPDADGCYVIELAVGGVIKKYRTWDKSIVHDVDTSDNRCMGLKLNGDIIVKVYDPACVTGNWSHGNGYFVTSFTDPLLACESTAGVYLSGVLAENCEIYDVSGHSEYKGIKTTLREGDRICGYKNPRGEVTHIYVTARYEEGTSLYWNVNRNASRKPDADGWYVYKMIKMGKTGFVTVKTKDAKLAKQIDTYNPAAMTLRVNSQGIVTKAYNSNAFTIGYEHLSGIHVVSYNSTTGRWLLKYRTTGAEANVDMSEVTIYNFSGVYDYAPGERTTLRPGDRIECIYNRFGKVEYAWVFERESGSPAYWLKNPVAIDAATGHTKRQPAEDGYYYFEVTAEGKAKTVKTKDVELATALDGTMKNNLPLAFGLKLKGDVIEAVYSALSTKEIASSAQSYYDVTAINGNTVTLTRLKPGSSNTGDVQTINVAYADIYNVSTYAPEGEWGKETKLKVGDRVQSYYGNDGKTITIIFVVFRNTHEAGAFSYCEHCDQEVFWQPYVGTADYIKNYSYHYYLTADYERELSTGWGPTGGDVPYDFVLDLNGFTYRATKSYAFAVRGTTTLTVLDTSKAKTGRITGAGVQAQVVVEKEDGTTEVIKSEYQSSQAGIFRVLDNGVLNLRGGTYTRTVNREVTNLRRGGAIVVETDNKGRYGTLNIYDGVKIVDNTMDAPLDLATTCPKCNQANLKRVLVKGEECNRCMNKECPEYDEKKEYGWTGQNEVRRAPQGGGIYNVGGVVNIYGGVIANNGKIHEDFKEFESTAVGNGGNIFNAGGELNIYGGKISGGWCVGNGGNIYVSGGKVTVAGGEISKGTSVNGADNIIIAPDKGVEFVVTGGKITGDTVVSAGNTMKISGKAQITMGNEQGLFLNPGVKAKVGEMKKGANIVISSTGVFTTDFKSVDAAKAAKAYFTSSDKEVPITVSGKALTCGKAKCLNGHISEAECKAASCDKEMLYWQPWSNASSLPTSGNYYLTKDVTVDSTTAVSGTLVLDLNGYNVTRKVTAEQAEAGSQPVFNAAASTKLTITDLSGNAKPGTVKAVLADPSAGTQGIVTVATGANVEIYNGIFDGRDMKTSSANAGGIFCGGGNLTIHGGEFYGWSNAQGANDGMGTIFGGWSTSVLTINDGTFYGGTTKQGGMFSTTGKIIINGGLFDGNNTATNTAVDASKPRTVATHGGFIHLANNNNAYLEINGGTFKAGQGYNSGGMIYVEANNASVVNINGGTFQASSKAQNGGFIRFRGKDMSVSGVTLEGFGVTNAANADIVSFEGSGTLTIGKDAVIDGGIMVKSATKLVLKDNVQIGKGASYSIKLAAGASMDLNGLNSAAKVYINHTEVGVAFAEVKDEATAKSLVDNKIVESANENYIVIADGNKLTVKVNTDFKNWTLDNSLPTSGKYRLTQNVTINEAVVLNGELELDLNGFNITRNVSEQQITDAAATHIIQVPAGVKLTITDSSTGTPGTLTVVQPKDADDKTIPVTGYYGLIRIDSGSEVVIDNGIFDGKDMLTSNVNAGGIFCGGGKLTINGGTFYGWSNSQGANAGNGTIFGGWSTSVLTINDGTFYGGTTKQGGMFSTTGKIVINGGLFDGNNSATNTAVDASKPRTVATHGGLIHLAANANASLDITGGTFKSAQGANSGGMIYVEANNAIVVNITGGTFQATSKAQNGGFIRFRGKDLNISGVTLEGFAVSNAANADIISFEGTGALTIGKDAVIGGGIMIKSAAKLVLKDNVKINAGTNYAIKLGTGTLDISDLDDDAKVHINHTDATKAFAEAADEATAKKLVDDKIIVSADPNFKVIADGKNLTVKVQIQWNEWNAAAAATMYGGAEADNLHLTKLPTAGDYKLIADVTIDARVAMTGNVNLNLNGHTATRVIKSGAADYGFYTTNAKGNLYITDEIKDTDPDATVGTMQTVFDTGVTTCAGTGFLGYVGAGYTITIDEGNFDFRNVKTTASATTGAGAIIVDGTLTINGGTFYGANAGTTGFGTVIGGRSAGVITINDGTFYGNNAKQGGIISTTGNLTINGGLFDGNTNASNGKVNADLPQAAATHGGLFYVAKALTITGGEFKAGRVSGSGGIAYVTGSGSVISGGTYTAGGQTNYAGFFRFDGSATISGVTLTGGKATTNGNNIAFGSNGNATLTIGQDAVIDGGIMFRSDKTGNKLVLVGNAQVNGGTGAAYSLNLANATVHIGDVANAAVATVGSTFTNYIATYDADGNVTGVATN